MRSFENGELFMKFFVGTSGYGHKEWKGTFYPQGLSDKKMLGYYAERFSTVEINYTFRRLPTRKVVLSWAEQVPGSFRFVLKAHRASRIASGCEMQRRRPTPFSAWPPH